MLDKEARTHYADTLARLAERVRDGTVTHLTANHRLHAALVEDGGTIRHEPTGHHTFNFHIELEGWSNGDPMTPDAIRVRNARQRGAPVFVLAGLEAEMRAWCIDNSVRPAWVRYVSSEHVLRGYTGDIELIELPGFRARRDAERIRDTLAYIASIYTKRPEGNGR